MVMVRLPNHPVKREITWLANLLTDYGKLEELVARIRHNLRVVVQLDVKVKLVEPMSIRRGEGKVKRVIDLRSK